MTDKNLTEIIAIVDRSGSMAPLHQDAIGGFNTFLKEQQENKVGKCLLTYVQFDHEYEVVHDGIDIQDMKPLDSGTYCPRGSTALLDAIGRTVNTVGERLHKTPEDERPGNVVVVIITDGEENASREFSLEQIKSIMDRQVNEYSWSVMYIAQNIDAFAAGSRIGLDMAHKNVFLGNAMRGAGGQAAAYNVASKAVSHKRYASSSSQCMDWSPVQKESYTRGLVEVDEQDMDQRSVDEQVVDLRAKFNDSSTGQSSSSK